MYLVGQNVEFDFTCLSLQPEIYWNWFLLMFDRTVDVKHDTSME